MFWDLTKPEVLAVLKRRADSERAANLRAGLVAAAVLNTHRKKGTRPVMPGDFFREKKRQHMTAEQAKAFMNRWAKDQNKVQESAKPVPKRLKRPK